jgi:hypothetical protein
MLLFFKICVVYSRSKRTFALENYMKKREKITQYVGIILLA